MQLLRFTATVLVASAISVSCAGPATRHAEPVALPAPAGMVGVERGRFIMGAENREINEAPEHVVFAGRYSVDIQEVPAAVFAAFLNERGNEGEAYFSENPRATVVRDGEGRWKARPGFEKYPANNVSWYGAFSFCEWADKRLPTEAEWEKAARGTDGRLWPWGDEVPVPERAQFEQDPAGGIGELLEPVDTLSDGVSPYGLHHAAGNVWEWVNDWYRQNYCDWCGDDRERSRVAGRLLDREGENDRKWAEEQKALERFDPAGPPFGSFKVLRGGSWSEEGENITTTVRYWRQPRDREVNIGFRCAGDPETESAASPDRN